MKKLMNKKGFTLVELLAVIVILAVIILVAMNAVIPQMENARKSSFETEIQTFAKAAETYFTKAAMTDSSVLTTGGCVSVAYLRENYVNKADSKYLGAACIKDNKVYITITSGVYQFSGKTTGAAAGDITNGVKKIGEDGVTGYSALNYPEIFTSAPTNFVKGKDESSVTATAKPTTCESSTTCAYKK